MFESSLYDCGPCIELVGGLVCREAIVFETMHCLSLSPFLGKWSTSAAQPGDPFPKVCPLSHCLVKMSTFLHM